MLNVLECVPNGQGRVREAFTGLGGVTFAVVSRAGGLRVEAEGAGNRREQGGWRRGLLLHLVRYHGPLLSTTVSNRVPALQLQQLTALLCLGDETQYIQTYPERDQEQKLGLKD